MAYTISKASDLTGINPTTIRYYDKEGLLPGIQRMNGIRLFTDEDIKWLHVLSCLKIRACPSAVSANMPGWRFWAMKA